MAVDMLAAVLGACSNSTIKLAQLNNAVTLEQIAD